MEMKNNHSQKKKIVMWII